jgi:hypothetical protein
MIAALGLAIPTPAEAQGQPFRVRQNIYEQPGDPLD